jgi:hypothetical protein
MTQDFLTSLDHPVRHIYVLLTTWKQCRILKMYVFCLQKTAIFTLRRNSLKSHPVQDIQWQIYSYPAVKKIYFKSRKHY